ncbi:DUF692 domain-containing protein [Aliiglaciecola sp. CAU 1673]|uniref:HvfB family MNIO-type RiPP peptide maturase n=1 Tax=Aliiglaciecola sp. CAU 1673 TaxID=3032595 RepID=UPI0023DB71C5|nr:DUF692 domain-containing protein [Aliiglaciecola sp. CAU 1673]MDF2179561.1 DUF692 domain-containing protein [Aliiglaciecola sp. CAU 1673]
MVKGSGGDVGLGLRRDMFPEVLNREYSTVQFWEVAPENWMTLGGKYEKQFREMTARYPFKLHGLSLSIGSPDPLDVEFIKGVKAFMNMHHIEQYSEHLSYCSGNGHMYDLMPIPFTEEAIAYVSGRVRQVQDILERPLILENVSYYAAPGQKLSEQEFTLAILEESDCELLLDVNNVYVNSINHGYDPIAFIQAMPTKRIAYGHIAGHYNEADDLIVDTHGSDVIDKVWALLEAAYQAHGIFPTLLERDFNIPPLNELIKEVEKIHDIQQRHQLLQGRRA